MELTGYLAVARRWWWTLLVATWIAAVSGYVVASRIPPTYEAATQMLVGPYNTDRDTLAAAGALVQTYSSLVTTTPLLESAIAETGAPITAIDLRLASRVTANDTTRFLTIRVQNTDPQLAALLANKLADEISQVASGGTNRPDGLITVVDSAVAPTEPIAPQRSLIVGLAALAALIGAMVLVMLVEYLSAAVRTEEELGRLTGLPFLGKVDTNRSLPSSTRGLIDQAPESAAAAAYRLVVAKVAFREPGRPASSIVVVGTGSDGTNAQVAANLAAITARSGRQVVLVDADPSSASVTRIFGLGDRTGLNDLVATPDADVARWLIRVSANLRIMPSGTAPDEDAVDVRRAAALLAGFATGTDLVVVATGAAHLSAGALVWAQAGDAAIIVVTRDQARRDDVEYAAESLRLVEASAAGTVFADRKRGIRRGRPSAPPPNEHARPYREPAAIEPPIRAPNDYDPDPLEHRPVVHTAVVRAAGEHTAEAFVPEPEIDEDTPTITSRARRNPRRSTQPGERGY